MPPEPPVPERPFEKPWQARAFALAVALHARGAFTWPEWADALGRALAAEPPRPYWHAWLAALEAMAVRSGATEAAAIAATARAWRVAADRTPHGEPIRLDRA